MTLTPTAQVSAAPQLKASADWRRPSLMVAAALLLVCVPSSARLTPADLAAGIAVALVVLRWLADGTTLRGRGWLPFAAVVASVAIAAVAAPDLSEGVVGFVRYTEVFVLIPVAVAMSLRDRVDARVVAGAFVATTVFEGAVGVWQRLTGTGASYAGEYVRAVGTFGAEQIMALGSLMGYGIVVTLALGLAARGRARFLLLATAAFLVLPLGFTLSRGAWIATSCAVVVVLLVFSWRLGVALLGTSLFAVVVLATGVGPAPSIVDERVASIAASGSAPDRSVRDRYALWGTAVDMWADHPVTGVGLKQFARFRDTYAPMSLSAGSDVDDPQAGFRRQPLLSAHNQYLMVLSEQGTIGILAFGALLGTLTAGAFRRTRSRAPGAARTDARWLDLAAPGLITWTLIDFVYGDIGAGPTGVTLGVMLGLVARRAVIVPRPIAPEAGR
ncbi:O-antigen ligase family protein [Phytohabitans rumicis]|uniref:Membrane protein n=1 Tax=Phytohabitans rumicis TaxID=1076125 RepID=A0A6V8KXS6_9ACTN|nr:O-antigen ligase family protein [Phytohabitans rumicis]GFJ87241.1 membrane protein [Phytohabitans rumicis]